MENCGNIWLKLTPPAVDLLISAMAKREGVTEALKASDQMEWVGRMNNIRSRAEEIILHELVYA